MLKITSMAIRNNYGLHMKGIVKQIKRPTDTGNSWHQEAVQERGFMSYKTPRSFQFKTT
jgi:hypothetical protein